MCLLGVGEYMLWYAYGGINAMVCIWRNTCYGMHMEARGQFEVLLFFQNMCSRNCIEGQDWEQAPLPEEASQ